MVCVHEGRKIVFAILSLAYVFVNLLTASYWHSNLSLLGLTSDSGPLDKKDFVSTHRYTENLIYGNITASNTATPTNQKVPTGVWQSKTSSSTDSLHLSKTYRRSEGRLETLERLKQVLQINETLDVLRKIKVPSDSIPLWSDIDRLYGPSFPNVVGLDQCHEYRNSVSMSERWVAPAGLFHTGTNLLSYLMRSCCQGIRPQGQVPYGKHNPIDAVNVDNYRVPNPNYQSTQNLSHVLPIVMVRHPLDWMKSMCQQKFAVSWKNVTMKTAIARDGDSNSSTAVEDAGHLPCPSLSTPISVDFYRQIEYDNLLGLWHQWNQGYLKYDKPRLIVRLEDLVYTPMKTLQQICECAGGNFRYSPNFLEQRKGGVKHKEDGNYLMKAWIRHSLVSVDMNLASSLYDQQLFRKMMSKTQVQSLLDTFHYHVI